jgi:hypothetical protein
MWTYVLSDLAGNEFGELTNATGRSLSFGLNRAATSAFSIRADHELAVPLFAGDTLLQVWQDDTIRFHGNVVSTELSSSGTETPTIAVSAADPAWRLSKRLLGISAGGTKYEGDRAKTARKMINELNGGADGGTNPHTGISLLPEASYVGGSGTYVAGPYRPALTCINDLAHTLNGFDWYMAPLDGSTSATVTNEIGSWTKPLIAQFEATNAFGAASGAVFEFGSGQHNVRTINYTRDLADTVNKAFHTPNDLGTESVLEKDDSTSLNYRGRYVAVADAFGITDTGLRNAWLEEVIRVKKNPRYVVSMTLDIDDGTGRVPQLGTDYWIGDTAEAVGAIGGTELFSGVVRVYGVNVTIDEQGLATTTPVLLDEEGEAL